MKRVYISLFVFINLLAQEDIVIDNSFITKYEYGKLLYNNPRGIGCNKCHGEKATGSKIVSFKHAYKGKNYQCNLSAPSIKNIDYSKFSKKLNSKKIPRKKIPRENVCEKLTYYSNIMPTYFLVEEEIEAIYTYVKRLK